MTVCRLTAVTSISRGMNSKFREHVQAKRRDIVLHIRACRLRCLSFSCLLANYNGASRIILICAIVSEF